MGFFDPSIFIVLIALQSVQRGFSGQCYAVRPVSRPRVRHQAHDRIIQVFATQSQSHNSLTDKIFNPVFHKRQDAAHRENMKQNGG